jgi:hypothetical protein
MARPASRYFVPVIRKISEMKKAENIQIDQQFKADLRGELMLRAGLGEAGETRTVRESEQGLENGAMGNPVMDYFRKWKYQLALVPVALLLMIVAVQSLKMPVKITGETVVPVAGNTQSAEPAKVGETSQTSGETQIGGAAQSEETTVEPTQETVVSPVGVIGDGQDTDATLMITGTAPAETDTSGLVLEANGGGEESVVPKKVSRTVQTTEQTTQTVQYVPQPVPYKAPSSIDVSGKESAGSNKKLGIAAGDVPPELIEQTGISAGDVTVSGENNVQAQVTDLQSPASDLTSVQKSTITQNTVVPIDTVTPENTQTPDQALSQYLNSEQTAVPGINLLQTTALTPENTDGGVSEFNGEVHYDQYFVEDKESLENDILKNLMDDGRYAYASVSEADDGVVTVELNADDGSVTKKTYKRNARTHAWDEVIYVQKYYFEDTLQYDRMNLSVPSYGPSFGNSFHDADYYRYGY